ncbi:MAG: hypothetical protein JHC35_06940 [Sulfuricurvum sp.]|uniref:hypothetical protein n=1 Tax=Sulfuricurvum sp. TaxID=2025608 RepID=UPI0025F25945|nr:hypothetical protein [Sulfuricurvum sp.]MCI4407002.1 hypothetical protein [Sulfuricurvum sp.]
MIETFLSTLSNLLKSCIMAAENEIVLQGLQNELLSTKEKMEDARSSIQHYKKKEKKARQELQSTKRKLEALEEQEKSKKRARLSYFI